MPNASNVSAGKPNTSGSVYWALLSDSPTIPTDAVTTLTGFTELGYVSEDGVVNDNSPSSEQIKAWGGDVVLALQTEKPDEFKLTLIETLNIDVMKAVYGSSNVTGTALSSGVALAANSDEPEEAAWVIEMIVRGGILKRIVIPDGKITEVGEITYKDDEATGYELTIQAMPDSSGNTHYEYSIEAE